MMNVGRTMAMFNAWVRQADARARREIRRAEAEERRALTAEAAKEGKTLEQKMTADLQKQQKKLKEEMADLTSTMKEEDSIFTRDQRMHAKGQQGLQRRLERLQAQMDKTETQMNENTGFTQTLFYGKSRVRNVEEVKDEEENAEEEFRGSRNRRSAIRLTTMDQG